MERKTAYKPRIRESHALFSGFKFSFIKLEKERRTEPMRHIRITIIPEKIPVHGENMGKNKLFLKHCDLIFFVLLQKNHAMKQLLTFLVWLPLLAMVRKLAREKQA